MAALSNNKYDVANWIKKIIDSSSTEKQFKSARNLVFIYSDRYGDYSLYGELYFYYYEHLDDFRSNNKQQLLKG